MMASTVQIDEDFFICSICNDNFDDPKSLPCLHNFCNGCLCDHIVYSAKAKSFFCPICRREISAPDPKLPASEWADHFPGNFWLKDLMAKHKEASITSTPIYSDAPFCPEHSTEQMSVFCTSCKVHCCPSCFPTNHSSCGRAPTAKELASADDIRALVEKLDYEIANVEGLKNQCKPELDFLDGQLEKVKSGIEHHAENFYKIIDNGKMVLYKKLETEYQQVKRRIINQEAKDKELIENLMTLRSSAGQCLKGNGESFWTVEELASSVDQTLGKSALSKQTRFQRLRASFTPDYRDLKREVTLGTISFYNPGGSEKEPEVDQLGALPSFQEEFQRRKSYGYSRSLSSERCSPSFHKSMSAPVLRDQEPDGAPEDVPEDEDDVFIQKRENAAFCSETRQVQRRSAPPTCSTEKSPDFGFTDTGSLEDVKGRRRSEGYACNVNPNPELSSKETRIIPSKLIQSYTLKADEENRMPEIKSIIVSQRGFILVTDANNKSLKIFNKDGHCSLIVFQQEPCGLVEPSSDKVLVSLPESGELVTVEVGDAPCVMTSLKVRKKYTRLAFYRSGIAAALCPALNSIDVITMQGKPMKTFPLCSNDPPGDVPFCVDSNHGFLVWDSGKRVLFFLTKTGSMVSEMSYSGASFSNVAAIACDTSDKIYIVNNGLVAMVTQKGECCGEIQNIFSCQTLTLSSSGQLYVVENGGQCKVFSL